MLELNKTHQFIEHFWFVISGMYNSSNEIPHID